MGRRGTSHKRSNEKLPERITKRLNIAITKAERKCSCAPWKVCSCTLAEPNLAALEDNSSVDAEKALQPTQQASSQNITYSDVTDRLSAETLKDDNDGVTRVELSEDDVSEPAASPTGRSRSRTPELTDADPVKKRVCLEPGPKARSRPPWRSRSRSPKVAEKIRLKERVRLEPSKKDQRPRAAASSSKRTFWADVRDKRHGW